MQFQNEITSPLSLNPYESLQSSEAFYMKSSLYLYCTFDDVQKYSGMDPDYSKKDMWNQIENGASSGQFPECKLIYHFHHRMMANAEQGQHMFNA